MVAVRIFRSTFLQSYLILGGVWLQKKIISIGFSCLYIFLLLEYYLSIIYMVMLLLGRRRVSLRRLLVMVRFVHSLLQFSDYLMYILLLLHCIFSNYFWAAYIW